MARHAVRPSRRQKFRRALVVVVVVLAVGALGVSAWLWTRAQQTVSSITGGQGGSPIDALIAQPLAGESSGQVNILLAGSSFDDIGHGGSTLTDSIMVATMNLNRGTVAIISIPRDLMVTYRGEAMKINAVYAVAASGSPGATSLGNTTAGMAALGYEVEQVTGLHIHQYVLVGYNALHDVVDAVGGIDVTIAASDPRGIYDPNAHVKLANGLQHLDGTTALALARARNDPVPGEVAYGLAGSDFDRQKNQRLIMAALLAKVKGTPTLANPLTLATIFDTLSANVRTDLTIGQVRRVYDLVTRAGDMQGTSIKGDKTTSLLIDYRSKTLGDVLIPAVGQYDYSAIKAYVASVVNG